ncbi:G-type lectin S-receptor-like serine threonine-kinase At4g03230 isoform X2 [Olea europaea subsp. europaea]|uniref:Receptor-like serine/threonine-protein kinase n=1 Tax=Olea europaea subsp. europaea TaxID=158383 RepID=A0A8S0PMQ2_OLEEU|nr:G-type lectin S-receptor-like serine threonine-kinase At4g03230 isoform X2 [Olea europaea subsp. europaea]
MQSPTNSISVFFYCTILVVCLSHQSDARDTITTSNPLRDDARESLVSANGRFELGFFTPGGNNRYVGIWYHNLPPRVVWVANRDNPVLDSSGSFAIAKDGNLKVLSNGNPCAITKLENAGVNRTVKLSNDGNLIFFDGPSPSEMKLWQSFDHPTDTFLPGMKMDDHMVLTSWSNSTDPATGNYTFQKDQELYKIQNGSNPYWRSRELGLSSMIPHKKELEVAFLLSGFDESTYQSSVPPNETKSFINFTRLHDYTLSGIFMNSTGKIQYYRFSKGGKTGKWTFPWSEPHDACSVYNACGNFGICDSINDPRCQCLPGFQAVSMEDWSYGDYSGGCQRRNPIRCDNAADKMKQSQFLKFSLTNFWGSFQKFYKAQTEEECEKECQNNCKCNAYYTLEANATLREGTDVGPMCYIGTEELEDLQLKHGGGGFQLSIRIAVSDKGSRGRSQDTSGPDQPPYPSAYAGRSLAKWLKDVIIIIAVFAAALLVCCFSYNLYRRKRMTKSGGSGENSRENPVLWPYESSDRQVSDLMDEENKSGVGVPFCSWESILAATENFSDVHKLGRGGFGPVYKGMFPGGQEIAVKRLSTYSLQGINEFRNEVILIAKLQHRNLVRLLGYCIKENEKILLYEYMPNKSLDAFIFDKKLCMLLYWKKRFDIILGIARGVLYLHQDSRLRIIHRDLKTSNILLDEEMNPKISDFGLARIVEGKGTEASTNKVMGTYGYMSPEYALDGLFSIKSDVFSFGVVVLEIISGKRNTGFYGSTEALNLLGYVSG